MFHRVIDPERQHAAVADDVEGLDLVARRLQITTDLKLKLGHVAEARLVDIGLRIDPVAADAEVDTPIPADVEVDHRVEPDVDGTFEGTEAEAEVLLRRVLLGVGFEEIRLPEVHRELETLDIL